jgi:hypothetical protein
MSRRPLRLLAGFLFALALASVLAACSSDAGGQDAHLRIRDVAYERLGQQGERVVRGTVYNPGAEAVSVAQITVSLFGENNVRVGETQIQVQDIPARDSVNFRHVLDTSDDVQAVRVRGVMVP